MALALLTLAACSDNTAPSNSTIASPQPETLSPSPSVSQSKTETDDEQSEAPNSEDSAIIKAVLSKNCNYVYHMLSVSNCGYENVYGEKYKPLHPQADLQALKQLEQYITVKGGEHVGGLYGLCVSGPASLNDDISVSTYYEALADLFGTGDLSKNLERYQAIYEQVYSPMGVDVNLDSLKAFYEPNEPFKQEIAQISKVMADNYSVYSEKVWETSQKELTPAIDELNKQLMEGDYAGKWEEILNRKYQYDYFLAIICNSIEDGPEAIDISYDKDVFDLSGDYSSKVKFISHEFGIYLLKDALSNTQAFQLSYWGLTEGLAEYFNTVVSGGATDTDWNESIGEYVSFYKQLKDNSPEITPEEMFIQAIDYFKPAMA